MRAAQLVIPGHEEANGSVDAGWGGWTVTVGAYDAFQGQTPQKGHYCDNNEV